MEGSIQSDYYAFGSEIQRYLLEVSFQTDFYELVAFICWYILLILCCVIPTVCVYRRRRRAEQERNDAMIESIVMGSAGNGANGSRDNTLPFSIGSILARDNDDDNSISSNFWEAMIQRRMLRDGILGSHQYGNDSDDDLSMTLAYEFAYEVRMRREQEQVRRLRQKRDLLTQQVQYTKMVVAKENIITEKDLNEIKYEKKNKDVCSDGDGDGDGDTDIESTQSPQKADSECIKKTPQDKPVTDIESDTPSSIVVTTPETYKKQLLHNLHQTNSDASVNGYSNKELVYDEDVQNYICLPSVSSNPDKIPLINGGPRLVPGTCSICLCEYEVGDSIVWSSNVNCQHAFHEDCILTWLTKKEEQSSSSGSDEEQQNEAICPFCRQPFIAVQEIAAHQQQGVENGIEDIELGDR